MSGITTPSPRDGKDKVVIDGRDYLVVQRCATCGEPVYLTHEQHGYEYTSVQYCACHRAKYAQQRIEGLRKRGISDAMSLSMRFEQDKRYNPKVSDTARRYVENWREMQQNNVGLLFTGNVGTGKTFYASCIANALIDKGVMVIMTTLSKIINASFEEYPGILRDIEKAGLVVFDDVGAERNSSFASERAFDAIDARVRSGTPILVTTNLSPNEMGKTENLRERRIYDRILGACAIVPVTGPSIRAQEKREKMAFVKQMLEGKYDV